MSIRGYVPFTDADGERIYAEFTINSVEQVRFTLKDSTDSAAEAAYDVSAAALAVYFRASIEGNATVPVNVLLTKTNGGADGVVSGDVVFRTADFTGAIGEGAAGQVICAVVVVNTSVSDAKTVSGDQETVWQGVSPTFLRPAMNEAAV